MSILKKIYEKFKLKYDRILSDTNIRKYMKKKYDFKKFLIYFLLMYFLSISIFIIIWSFKNDNYKNSLISSNNRIEDIIQSSNKKIKSKNFGKYRSLSSSNFKEDTINVLIFLNTFINDLKLDCTKILKKEKYVLKFYFEKLDEYYEDYENLNFYFMKLINGTQHKKNPDIISLIKNEIEANGSFKILLNFRNIRNLKESTNNSTNFISNSSFFENITYTNDNIKLIDDIKSSSNSSLKNKPFTKSNINNLVLIQGWLILLQSLLIITYISFRFVKIRYKYLIYKAVSFICCFNNFVQFQYLALIVTKIHQSNFHARFTIPYTHSAVTVFYTMFIDSDYIVNSVAATISGIVVILFSIGYDWMNDSYFLIGAFLIISYCYFTFVLEIDKKHLFLVDENNKNNLRNLMNTLENLNSGMIVYSKNENFECNKKFVEIFKINLNFANKEDLDKLYLKFILFTNLTDFNTSLSNAFIKTVEIFHQKFIDHERFLFELIISIEEMRKLEEEIIIDKLVNIDKEEDEYNNNKNENYEINKKENGNTLQNGKEHEINNFVNEGRVSNRRLELPENGSKIVFDNHLNLVENNYTSGLPQRRKNNYHIISNEENKIINKNDNPNFDSSLNNLLDLQKVNHLGALNIPSLNENDVSFKIINQKSKDYNVNNDLNYSLNLINYSNNNHLNFNNNDKMENNLLISKVKSGDLKQLIKSKSLRNTIMTKNKNQISDINGLQQTIYDFEKSKQDSNLNLNVFNKENKYSFNNNYSSNLNNSKNDLNSLNNQSIEIKESDRNTQIKKKINTIEKEQPKLSRRRKSLYNTIKENELRASNNEKLNELQKNINNLREKLEIANHDFANFKNFFFTNTNTDQYTYLATKKFSLDNEDYTYRIYFRYNDMSDSMEFLIDDLSTVLRMEDIKSQFKYKKYFLDKFSHEFRNPILNVKELVKNVKLLYQEYGKKLQNALKIEEKDSNLILNFLGKKSNSNKNLLENVMLDRKNSNISRNEVEDLNKTIIFINEGPETPSYKLSLNQNEDMISSKSVELKTARKSAFLKADNLLPARFNKDKNNNKKSEISDTLISKISENAFKINNQTSRIVMRKTGEFFGENYNNINNNFNNYDSSSNNINYNNNLNNPENNFIYLDSNSIDNFSLKKIKKENENNISNKDTITSRESIYHKNSLDKKFIESNMSCSYYDNINHNDNINNHDMINKIPKENSKIINKCKPIIDYQSIKDSFFIKRKEDLSGQILLNNARRIIIMDETHENIYSDLRHIKNLCEYMSLLISDFDFISNSLNTPLVKNKTINSKKSLSFNTNRNNNSNDNNANSNNRKNNLNSNLNTKIKEIENPESLARNLSVKKDSSDINMNSNRYSVLNKEYYMNNNFISNNAVLGSGIIYKNSKRENDIEKTSFEITKFIKYFINIFQTKIFLSDKNITLEYSIGFKVPEKINHDQAKIKLIIFNLLCNSVKFTSNGIIKIEVDTDSNNLIFNILDSGIGIKEENTYKLLKPINMVNICQETNQGGMGMGFYVTRKFLDLLKGTITINSFYGLGTLIELKIPFNLSRVTSNYTLLLNEKIPFEHSTNNLANISPYFPVNPSKKKSRNKPMKFRSHMPILHKKLKDHYEISSIHFDKSKTENQKAFENKGQFSESSAKNSTDQYKNFKNLKTNQNVININNNFYNNRKNFNKNNPNSNANKLREINTEMYNTNIFRPNMIDEMRSRSLIKTNSITNGNNYYYNNSASPGSNYTKKTFYDKENKTIVLTDQNFIMNYNSIHHQLNNFITNQNINENVSIHSENGENYSIDQSNLCYSQEDLKDTIKISNYNFNLNNISMEEKDGYQNNISTFAGDSKIKNIKTDGNQLNLSLANKFNYITYNIKQKRYSKSISERKHKYENKNKNGNTNSNNYDNINKLNNFSSSNNLSNYLNKQNSDISNKNSNQILNKLTTKNSKNNLKKIDSGLQKGEIGLTSSKKMMKYSQKNLNNFVSFENAIRILLVDDERLIRQSGNNVINKYFKKKGINYEIEECADGVECLFKIYEGIKNGIKYDMIITDETMNFMKGSTTAEILRNLMNDNKMYFLKIVMVTSYEISTISPSVKKNLDKIFTKPLSINTLELIFT